MKKEKTKPVLMDGAGGTCLWNIAKANGVEAVPVWRYNIEHPDYVRQLHELYIEAGAQIILTNTFGANRWAVEGSSGYSVEDVVSAGVRLAKEAAEGKDVKVCLSAGPLSQLMEPYGDLTEQEVEDYYTQQLSAGMREKPDLIQLETFMDVEMMKVALNVAKGFGVPVFCCMTFEKVGKTMMGQSVQDVVEGLEELQPDAVGLNCSLGPAMAVPIIKSFREYTELPLVFKPNAGLPVYGGNGAEVAYTPEKFVEEIAPAFEFADYVGGCCGTDPSFIAALSDKLRG